MKNFITLMIASTLSFSIYANTKVVYGTDDRKDIYETFDNLYLELAKSTAAMIPESDLYNDSTDQNYMKVRSSKLSDRGICEDAKFASQPTAAICSGFLVGPNLLVTAGHCVDKFSDCTSRKWVFDYGYDTKDKDLSRVPKSNVYSCVKIIEQKLDNNGMDDYAFIQLDRDVTDRKPLEVRTTGKVSQGDELVVIGHPTGLPTKIADNGIVRNNRKAKYFVSNLDTFGGNSGSAVFNSKTGIVEGILVRGEQDYKRDWSRGCNVPNKCRENSCRGEDVTRITNIKKLMQYAVKL